MPEETKVKVPKDLSAESRHWWLEVVENYDLEPHHVHLLTLAARTLDRGETARQALRKHGMTYVDKHGVKRPAPECLIEKNSAITFARLLRELRLDDVEDDGPRIPRNTQNWKRRNEGWLRRERDGEETPDAEASPRNRAQ